MSSYVVTGGTDGFVAELSQHLRAPVHRHPVEPITSWIHIVGGDTGDDPAASLTAAAASADQHLPRGEGASFIAVVPVWGVLAPPHDGPAELAVATARALAKVSIERWSREGRRINIVAYWTARHRRTAGAARPGHAARPLAHAQAGHAL